MPMYELILLNTEFLVKLKAMFVHVIHNVNI